MLEHKFIYRGTLPGLNDYLKAERSFTKKRSDGNDMKQQYQFLIINAIRLQLKRTVINNPVFICYTFYEPNTKRDLDNISAVAHKFIQDALVISGTLKNDGWKHITGYQDKFYVDKDHPRIEVLLLEE